MELIISVLAVYCTTYFITGLNGPWGIFWRLRRINKLGALQCFTCSSIYLSAIISLYSSHTAIEWLIHALAYAGGAILVHEIIERI